MVHVQKQLRHKLGSRKREAILLHSLPHSCYRVWCIDTQTVQQLRHVILKEGRCTGRSWYTESGHLVDNIFHFDRDETDLETPELIDEHSDDDSDSDDSNPQGAVGHPQKDCASDSEPRKCVNYLRI